MAIIRNTSRVRVGNLCNESSSVGPHATLEDSLRAIHDQLQRQPEVAPLPEMPQLLIQPQHESLSPPSTGPHITLGQTWTCNRQSVVQLRTPEKVTNGLKGLQNRRCGNGGRRSNCSGICKLTGFASSAVGTRGDFRWSHRRRAARRVAGPAKWITGGRGS